MFSPGVASCLHFKFFLVDVSARRVESTLLILRDRCSHRDWAHGKCIPKRRKNADIPHWILKQREKPTSAYTEARRILTPTTTRTHAHNTHHYFYYSGFETAFQKQACTHFVFSCAFHKWRTPRYPPSSTSYRRTKTVSRESKIEGAIRYFPSWRLTSLGLLYSSKGTRYISVRQMRKAERLRSICERHTNLATWDARKLMT